MNGNERIARKGYRLSAPKQMKLTSRYKGSPPELSPGKLRFLTRPAADSKKTIGLLMNTPADVPREKPADALRNPPTDVAGEHAVEIRFGQVGLLQVRLHTTDPGAVLDELTGRTATAPHFFDRTAVCLDLSTLTNPPSVEEIRGVIEVVRRAGMLSVGLAQGGASVDTLAQALDMPVFTHIRAVNKPVPVVQPAAPPPPEPPLPALIHHQPVRSGQRVYARNRDLIVTAMVAAGAEVMADGCVHIYGPLRGRVMAGAHGDVEARVFCQAFNAELVSIAGVFRVFETLPTELAGMPVQAWLAGEDLRIARIGE